MSMEGRKQATYPVWIGNLKETVTEKDLKRIFSRFTRKDGIASTRVIRDHNGQSKKSGYVNFYSEAEAENAAKAMGRSTIASVPIKTKGPSVLRKEDQSMAPITDCLFYMKTGNCKKREQVRLCECACVCVRVRACVRMTRDRGLEAEAKRSHYSV